MKYQIEKELPIEVEKPIILIGFMNTIVHRSCSLNGILSKWASQMSSIYNINSAFLFKYRCGIVGGKMHNTVPVELIYEELADQCVYYELLNKDNKEKFCADAYEIELYLETKTQSVRRTTATFLEKQDKQDKRIYCVTDFRLLSRDIRMFINHLNLGKYIDRVYSSCEYGATKKNGNLYRKVLEKIDARPEDCIMIGDNLQSDCINASANGIKSYWIDQRSLISKFLWR